MSLTRLNQDIHDLRSSYWDRITQASARKKLFLVEGDDDKRMVEPLLEAVTPLWETRVYVGVAGDRDKVLRKLEKNLDWFGLVDRDVWDDAQVADMKAKLPNLEVTRGWCIENHLCFPADVEKALALPEGTIQAEVDRVLDGWISYGAVWWTLQRVREGIMSGLPPSKLGHPVDYPCDLETDARTLREQLKNYPALFEAREVDALISEMRNRKRTMDALPIRDRIEQGVHGKQFFKEVIARLLNRVIGQRDAGDWRDHVAGQWTTRWPEYLVSFANRLVA